MPLIKALGALMDQGPECFQASVFPLLFIEQREYRLPVLYVIDPYDSQRIMHYVIKL